VTAGFSGWTQEHGASSRYEFHTRTASKLGTTGILHRAIQTGMFMDHRAIQTGMFIDSLYFYTIRTPTTTFTVKDDSSS